jgi:F420H(2)-dependent quinone reductase
MKRALALLSIGAGIGVAGDRIALELQKPCGERFTWLRRQVNDRVNPWLLEHNIPGTGRAEIAVLEHVGRKTGTVHHTPVHPTIRGEAMLIPVPLGSSSQWALNVLHAGRARLQLHDTLYDVDRPELIPVADTGFYPNAVAAVFDRLGWRYLRLNVAGSAIGTFAVHDRPAAAAIEAEPSLEVPFEIPVEPKMVDREPVPA